MTTWATVTSMLLTHPDVCERRKEGLKEECFLAFERDWVKTIDFGVRRPASEMRQILDLVKTDYSARIRCRRAVFHKFEYALDYEAVHP